MQYLSVICFNICRMLKAHSFICRQGRFSMYVLFTCMFLMPACRSSLFHCYLVVCLQRMLYQISFVNVSVVRSCLLPAQHATVDDFPLFTRSSDHNNEFKLMQLLCVIFVGSHIFLVVKQFSEIVVGVAPESFIQVSDSSSPLG